MSTSLRAPLIVHDSSSPYQGKYDEEIVVTLSDWYHDQMPPLIEQFISVTNPTGAEPVPDAALMNDSQNVTISVEPGKTYFFRIINMGAFAAQYFWFEGHDMQVVEVDGVWTEEAEASMLYVTVAQRYGVLVTARDDSSQNFALVGSMDQVRKRGIRQPVSKLTRVRISSTLSLLRSIQTSRGGSHTMHKPRSPLPQY